MGLDTLKARMALMFAGASVVWPALHCALTEAMMTPLQRALSSAWCGAGPHTAGFLGHTVACWAGAAAFLLAAAVPMALPRRLSIQVKA